jgi:anti-sigma B factor antagonist
VTTLDDHVAGAPVKRMTITLRVTEELDVVSTPRLREALVDALAVRPAAIVVDLRQCGFMDAQAMVAFLDGHRRAARLGIDFALQGLSPQARRLLCIAGLDDVFSLVD